MKILIKVNYHFIIGTLILSTIFSKPLHQILIGEYTVLIIMIILFLVIITFQI